MRPLSLIDVTLIHAAVDALGFLVLIVVVGVLFRQHDRSVLSELQKLNRIAKDRL